MISLAGFQVGESLSQGPNNRVFRARRECDGLHVVIKVPDLPQYCSSFAIIKEDYGALDLDAHLGKPISDCDGLTGIANRRKFDAVLENEWNRGKRHTSPSTLLMIDADYFKAYNDHLGQPWGTSALAA